MKERRIVRTPKQKRAWTELLDNPHLSRILFDGGARSGKTDVILLWLILQADKFPGARILIARKNLDHARVTIWQNSLRKILLGIRDFTFAESVLEARHLNGSVIRIAGLDDQDRVDKILGDEYLHVFINEATQISYDTMQTVVTRLSQKIDGCESRKLILDCNPKNQRHWLYKVGCLHQDPETGETLKDAARWGRLHWTPYDNPYLPPDYLDSLESLSGIKRRRMLDGEWCDNDGAVYEEFDEDVHLFKPFDIPPGWTRIRAIDFGFTNPFACLWGALDEDGRLYIYRERYQTQTLISEHAEKIKKLSENENTYFTVSDHDAGERAELHSRGVPTRAAVKDVANGIQAVKDRLKVQPDGRPRLLVSADCKNLISEFYEYVWEPPKDGRAAKEAPRKEHDHALDALRYLCMAVRPGTKGARVLSA